MHHLLMDQYCSSSYWPVLFVFLHPFPCSSSFHSRSTPVLCAFSNSCRHAYIFFLICPTSIWLFGVQSLPCSHLPLVVSPRVLTISASLLTFSHFCLPHLLLLLFSSVLIFSILLNILIIHLSILTSVLSSKSYSSLPSAQVSFPYIRSDLMAVGYLPITCYLLPVTRHICPRRFERDDIVTGPPYAGVDRHNGEIVAFHLSR